MKQAASQIGCSKINARTRLALCAVAAFAGLIWCTTDIANGQARGAFGKKHSPLYYQERLECDCADEHDEFAGKFSRINPTEIRESDEIWLVNTHEMQSETQERDFIVNYYGPNSSYETDLLPLIEEMNSQDERLNVIFVHGNRTNLEWAESRGWLVYNRMIAQCPEDVPVRFVIWAWPSERRYTALRDFRVKAELADEEGCHLGWFLQRVRPECQIGMIGYSYGARVVLGGIQRVATHGFLVDHQEPIAQSGNNRHFTDRPLIQSSQQLMADSSKLLSTLPVTRRIIRSPAGIDQEGTPADQDLPNYRVALIAAAFDREWLLPNMRLGDSYNLLQELLLVNNSADRAMRLYGLVDRRGFPKALGLQGLPGLQCLADFGQKVQQLDVAAEVGPRHSIDNYFNAPSVIARVHALIMPHDRHGAHAPSSVGEHPRADVAQHAD